MSIVAGAADNVAVVLSHYCYNHAMIIGRGRDDSFCSFQLVAVVVDVYSNVVMVAKQR